MALTEIAQTDVVTADPDSEVSEIVNKMADEDVGSVVITEDDEPVGIVTDRKIALQLVETESIGDMEISDVMTEDLVTVQDEETHFEVLERMSDEGIRRIPIVDEDGSLVGIISLDDLLVILSAEFSNASDVIEQQSPRL